MRKNKQKRNGENQVVFWISLVLSIVLVFFGAADGSGLQKGATLLMNWLKVNFSWLYLLVMLFLVVFCIVIALSKYGNIRLGPDDSRPEHSLVSWFAMLFCAGMGVGLVFWGISEPLSHYVSPIEGIEAGSSEAADFAIRSSFMHWGVHPWAAYAIIGLGLAYFQFRKNKPGLISSILIPLFGEERIKGNLGKVIDIFAVIVSVAGVATSLGMGCLQICGGLNYLFDFPNNSKIWFCVICVICVIYIKSSTSGVEKGIKVLSNFNLCLAFILLCISFILGPTTQILNIFTNGLGDYVSHFISDSLSLNAWGNNGWIYSWRIFYWAWWIAWAPFVGIFIARISKGRTIREFITGVILVPSLASIVWFSVFGGVGISVADYFGLEKLAKIVASPETALFIIFGEYPLGMILSVITLVLLIIFFITSADSATFVLSMLTSGGDLNPPNYKKVIWGIIEATIAYVLLCSGGLDALQMASVAAAFPFVFIMVLACVSILKALREDKGEKEEKQPN